MFLDDTVLLFSFAVVDVVVLGVCGFFFFLSNRPIDRKLTDKEKRKTRASCIMI